MRRLSVVIANYNYADYVGLAIESALALEWSDVEVVVVDDGSTDSSPEVLLGYADRARIVLGPNETQRVAVNRGFALTTGDIVIFLDADDVLPPELPRRLAEVWTPKVSKVQFQMQRIDRRGLPLGAPFPAYRSRPSPAEITRWASSTTAYPTPPGSGNAYARWFLDRIFPLDSSIGDFADSGCLAAAPFFGDVVSVSGTTVGYRQHGANDSNLLNDDRRFFREVARARARWRFAQRVVGVSEDAIDERPLRRSRELLQFRVAAARVGSGPALAGDSRRKMLADAMRSPFQVGPEGLGHRLLVMAWCLATLMTPWPRRLLRARYGRTVGGASPGPGRTT